MPWFTRCRVLAVPDWGCGHLIAAYYGSPIIQLFLVPCQTSAKFGRGPPCGALNTGGIYKFRPFIAARCYASAANAVMQCPSVCPSVTFVNSVKTNKRIFKFFSPTGSHIILVFLYQTSIGDIPMGTPPYNGGVECRRWGRQKSRFWANTWFHRVLWTVGEASAIHSPRQTMASWWHSLIESPMLVVWCSLICK